MTYEECYRKGRDVLAEAGIEEAALDSRLLLEYVCKTERHDLLAHGNREVESEHAEAYNELINKRARRIPLQHLTGVQNFMGLDFIVNENVLIPRQDTEILVEEVLRELRGSNRILDMCTGSGCILISLLHYSNDCIGIGVDNSREALKVAAENAGKHQLLRGSGDFGVSAGEEAGAYFVQSDLFENVKGEFNVIVSNPPYIKSDVLGTLMPEVREHEPLSALDGFADGLYFYRRIIAQSFSHLYRGGMLYLEIGHDQGTDVKDLMEQNGFVEISVTQDYSGNDRVVSGMRP